jgi:hypothetical protein
MKKNKQLLNEEIKRFHNLLNYDFYKDKIDESFSFHSENLDPDKDKLIYGSLEEEDEEEIPNETPENDNNPDDGGIPSPEEFNPDDSNQEDLDTQPVDDNPVDNEMPVDDELATGDDTSDGEVELDVTELVNGTKEAKQSADNANANVERLLSMVDTLQGKLESMSQISNKIDTLEKELEKRMPTPDEQVKLRSMDSYPYNITLSQFWADHKDSPYDTGMEDEENKDEEGNYVLTNKDVEDMDDNKIKDSFEDNPYDEEDI